MTIQPTWTILVPTIGRRAELFDRLLGILLPQLEPYEGRVRVLAYLNHGEPSLGEIRDRMVAAVDTDYVSFIDDDDTVPHYFIEKIMEALRRTPGVDHVGFLLDYYEAGHFKTTAEHTLRGPRRWCRWNGVLHRDFTHIDPIRAEIARKGSFGVAKRGRPEDRLWVQQVRRFVRTEAFIPQVMYSYFYDRATSASRAGEVLTPTPRPNIENPYFAWYPDSDR